MSALFNYLSSRLEKKHSPESFAAMWNLREAVGMREHRYDRAVALGLVRMHQRARYVWRAKQARARDGLVGHLNMAHADWECHFHKRQVSWLFAT